MAPKETNKAKAAGVGAGSFLDLKANLAEKEAALAKNKAAGKAIATVGGVPRPGKKPSVWAHPNRGVKTRAARDTELEAISRPTLESAFANLERKAKLYEAAKKGDFSGLTDPQIDALLVDFDAKPDDPYESDSDDVDESLVVPKPFAEDDPIIEYEDEFGRMRTAPRSEIPNHLLPRPNRMRGDEDDDGDEGTVIDNPANFFPVYEPSMERVAAIKEAQAEENNPLNHHYDASREVRAKGAAFYQLSVDDEEKRKQQREELDRAREETKRQRQEMGAVDVKPSEVEGMQQSESGIHSRAVEKRKRVIEERRKLIDARKKKFKSGEEPGPSQDPHTSAAVTAVSTASLPPAPQLDPFAALEEQSGHEKYAKKSKRPKSSKPMAKAAAEFLSSLERDLASGSR